MIVSMHQPNYLPWIGFFDKIKQSDVFVLLDDVQFPRGKKGFFGHRNKIKTNAGEKWLSVPIKNKSDLVPFNKTIINYETDWRQQHCNLIKEFYKKSKYFLDYYEKISNIIMKKHNSLTDLSVELIVYFMGELKINTELKYASDLVDNNISGGERIIKILEELGATHYLTGSGPGSMRYINEDEFNSKGINLSWQLYEHPKYEQLYGDFIPYLSVIDLLFNYGTNSKEMI
jgi:hypothetical protein